MVDKEVQEVIIPEETTDTIPKDKQEPEGESISSLVNADLAKQLIEMGFSKNVSEKSLFLNQNILDKAVEWIYENQNEPDFEEELRMISGQGQKKTNLTEDEIKAKAKELQEYARKKFLQKEKERAEEAEKMRIRMNKEMSMAKRDLDDAEMKRFVEQQKKKKIEEEKEKRAMLEQLARDKEERFGKKFSITGEVKKETNPFDDAKYFVDAIVKLYPTFRCGDQSKNCLSTIKLILSNILKNPTDEKFKKIKMTNPNVQERVGKIQLALKLLNSLGFIEDGEFYTCKEYNLDLFKKIVDVLDIELAKYNK